MPEAANPSLWIRGSTPHGNQEARSVGASAYRWLLWVGAKVQASTRVANFEARRASRRVRIALARLIKLADKGVIVKVFI